MTDDPEKALLHMLYEEVEAMFVFTGWDKDCDADARACVHKVESALTMLGAYYRLRSAQGKSEKP